MFYSSLIPQKFLTRCFGLLAESQLSWLKHLFISQFIKHYPVNMDEAIIEDPKAYASFNDFFIRQLKPEARPRAQADVLSPADGTISQLGTIHDGQLIQAKDHHYSCEKLLACDPTPYLNGQFMTIYLAPHNYHRVHMPMTGQLTHMRYVPGCLYPVNAQSVVKTQHLFARNERVICEFTTSLGPMAVILVGALNVGSIVTSFHGVVTPPHGREIQTWDYDLELKQADELGYFKMGSTVIILLPEGSPALQGCAGQEVLFGAALT